MSTTNRSARQVALPDISIRQLEYLVAVADSPTWAAGAASVGVSASALSQGLAELEKRLGIDLFEAQGRRRVLRAASAPVLDHARQVLALTVDVTEWSERLRDSTAGQVRLGLVDVAAVVHYPDVLRAFRDQHPDVELTLSVAPSASLLRDLQGGRLDLVVCVEPPEPIPGIETVELFTEPMIVYAPPGTHIGEPASWGPWVLFPDDSHSRQLVVDRLASLGARVDVAAESHQPDVIREMVLLGLGWTVLPLSQGQADDRELATGRQIAERTLVVARRSGSVHDPAADELGQRLQQHRRSE